MDMYGISDGVMKAAHEYFTHSRATGRTTKMIESLKYGDIVVCERHEHTHHIKRMAEKRGIKIKFVIINPDRPSDLHAFNRGNNNDRIVFDHVWVEKFYLQVIKDGEKFIDYWMNI